MSFLLIHNITYVGRTVPKNKKKAFAEVAHQRNRTYTVGMDQLKQLLKEMEDELRAQLKEDGDYEEYGEDGIRLTIYENMIDTLKFEYSDVIY